MLHKITLKLIFLILLTSSIIHQPYSIATIRYVSHTGSSTPPYTSWETSADSIQKCIDYSVDGDTIIVANGIYYESLIVNKYLWLNGSNMDSTVIDGTGLADITVEDQSDFNIESFSIIGKTISPSTSVFASGYHNVNISNCRIGNAGVCIFMGRSSGKVENVLISDCNIGILTFCSPDTCYPIISNSVLLMGNSSDPAIYIFAGGNPSVIGNVIIGGNGRGIDIGAGVKTMIIKNNIVSEYGFTNIYTILTTDSAIVENNIVSYQTVSDGGSIEADVNSDLINNIAVYNQVGIRAFSGTESDYNLFWQNVANTAGGLTVDSTDIIADPMFVNDTVPASDMHFNFHLQQYSIAIDRGDPNILDVDGTRSDIGAYGGPGGEMYTYLDLPPRPPVNVNAEVDSTLIIVTWNRNSEADISHYNIYRDTVANFTIDPSKRISSQTDTIYIQSLPQNVESLYYKITAVDNQGNESLPSEEVGVLITSVNEYQTIVNDYILYQNYPNPFNPLTKIGYKLKERGYVKLMVYDIKGELISVLVNEVQEAGYYEVEFSAQTGEGRQQAGLATGIYLYRIEIIGEGNIPRFSDMKKMILLR